MALAGLCLCFACQPAAPARPWQQVRIDSLYEIRVPGSLLPATDMHPYAGLQYYAPDQALYVLGIEDEKDNLGPLMLRRIQLPGYYMFVENTVFEQADSFRMESQTIPPPTPAHACVVGDYYASSRQWGEPLFYRVAVFETKDFFYQLVMWTRYEGACARTEQMDTIVGSFRLAGQAEAARTGGR
ncbi:MAG: hypothetical protein NW241_23560 [Bacteroidia bacterium]|nr:hypothetical protein [Bacteroidia bacterium]